MAAIGTPDRRKNSRCRSHEARIPQGLGVLGGGGGYLRTKLRRPQLHRNSDATSLYRNGLLRCPAFFRCVLKRPTRRAPCHPGKVRRRPGFLTHRMIVVHMASTQKEALPTASPCSPRLPASKVDLHHQGPGHGVGPPLRRYAPSEPAPRSTLLMHRSVPGRIAPAPPRSQGISCCTCWNQESATSHPPSPLHLAGGEAVVPQGHQPSKECKTHISNRMVPAPLGCVNGEQDQRGSLRDTGTVDEAQDPERQEAPETTQNGDKSGSKDSEGAEDEWALRDLNSRPLACRASALAS